MFCCRLILIRKVRGKRRYHRRLNFVDRRGGVHILNVVPDFGMSIVGQFFPEGFEKKMAKKVLQKLHEFVGANVSAEIKVQHIVGEGNVYEVSQMSADKINADVIVVAAHRPELKDYLLGPNAARVVRHAKCSVMVVRE